MPVAQEVYSVYLPRWEVRRDLYGWLDRLDRVVASLSGRILPVRSVSGNRARLSVSDEAVPQHIVQTIRSGTTLLNKMPISSVVHLKFEYDVPSPEDLAKQINSSSDEKQDDLLLWRSFVEFDVHDEVAVFVMALDLASPGSGFHGDYVLQNRDVLRLKATRSAHVGDAYEHVATHGLDRSGDLDFPDVWRTLNATNGLRWGVPDTPFGKVISAISYLYAGVGGSVRFSDLVWACYGLEGFFGAGHDSRGKQVGEKAAVLLNLDPDRVRKLVKSLYELRSKFMHGNSAASSALVEVQPSDGKVSTDEWDAQHVGAYFLFETARECIRRGIRSQDFGLVLK